MRKVCEVVSCYICNMEIYLAQGKKLEDTVLSLLDRNLGQNHHNYQANFYNSVKLAQTLLDRNMRVCSTTRANRGIPCDLQGEGICLEKGHSAFWRKGDVMVQVWKDKRLVQMISTIHDATVVNTGRKDAKTKVEIKKPFAAVQYNKFVKGIDRAEQCLSYYSVLRKTVKWSKKGGIVSAKLCNLQCIFCVQDTEYKQKSRVQELPVPGRKVLDIRSPESK